MILQYYFYYQNPINTTINVNIQVTFGHYNFTYKKEKNRKLIEINVFLLFMLTCEEIHEVGPESIIYVIHRLETTLEEQAIQSTALEERVKIFKSCFN